MKTIYKKAVLLLSFFVVLTFSGCRKSEEVIKQMPEPESLKEYYKFWRENSKGSFIFESTARLWTRKENVSQVMAGDFREGGLAVKGGPLKFGNHVVLPYKEELNGTPEYVYYLGGGGDLKGKAGLHAARDVFGTLMSIELQAPVSKTVARGEGTETVTGSLYIPKEIEYLAPVRNLDDSATFVLHEGFHIKWNEDSENLKGVLIYLEYDPGNGMNTVTHAKNYPQRIQKLITTKDVAEGYVIKNADIQALPNGSWIVIRIARVNYVVLKNREETYKVGAITTREGDLLVRHK